MKSIRKTKHVDIRLTPQEYDLLQKRADGNLSASCRRILLQDASCKMDGMHFKEAAYQIRKIGVNINQITARINAGICFIHDGEELMRALEKVYRIMEQIEDELRKDM